MAIKLEIDTNPPANAILETTFVECHVAIHVQHHNRSSLLAGKLHAILQREYVKGRDWYDLYWYLSQEQWSPPNFSMLNNALGQSGWNKGAVTADNWRMFVSQRLAQLDWYRMVEDVQRFLIEQKGLAEFKKEKIENLLG